MTLHDQLIKKPTNGLLPYARNSRTHSPEQIQQIAASIREFGFTNPVLIDEEDGIIAGHGRVLAAQQLGLEQVPCLILSGLTDTQKRAYVIADNKIALNAGWDEALLYAEMQSLAEQHYEVSLTGFSYEEIERSIRAMHQELNADEVQLLESETDAAPAPSDKAFAAEMNDTSTTGMVPSVPMYAEHHEAFIILSDNSIDEAWLRNKLGLDIPHQSYKDIKTMRPNVLTVQQFRERIGA